MYLKNHHQDLYPSLAAIGLHSEHLDQIASAWQLKKLDLSLLPDSLERAEWDIEKNPSIEKPLAYILKALLNGPYTSPKGFRSKSELQAIEAREKAAALKKLAEDTVLDRFDHWWLLELDEIKRAEIDSQLRIEHGSLTRSSIFLKKARIEYFRTKLFK